MTGDTRDLLPHLPRVGFRWRDGVVVTSWYDGTNRRDRYIVSLLRRFGDCPHLAPDAHGKARAEVTSALSLMFTEATDEVRSAAGEATSAVTTINVAVLYKLRWARMWVTKAGKKDQYFLELFYELYLARGRWHQDPRKPFDIKEHCALAHAIDEYHEAVGGGSWANAEVEAYLKEQGRPAEDKDRDVEMDAEADDVMKTKAAEDVEMSEAVEELGERIADFHMEGGKKMSFDFD